jgi:hypothetical protein
MPYIWKEDGKNNRDISNGMNTILTRLCCMSAKTLHGVKMQ